MAGRRNALIARRQAVGHTQESLALELHVERSTVVRWERGTALPQPWRRRELATALAVSLDELGVLLMPSAVGSSADCQARPQGEVAVGRREFLGAATGIGLELTLGSGGAERQFGTDLPEQLKRRTARLRHLDDYLGGADTYPLYSRELANTAALARGSSCPPATRRRLLSVLAEQEQLTGWAAFDAGQYTVATQLFEASRSAAEQAGDNELVASALAFLAYQQASTSGDGVAMAIASCDAAGPRPGGKVHALLWERRAWAHAVAGQAQDAEIALATAELALARKPVCGEPDWARWVDHAELQIMAGRCWAVLGRPLCAIRLLESALANVDDAQARDKALYLTWLASAYLEAAEVEQSAMVVGRALDLSAGVASVRPELRIRSMTSKLSAHHGVPAVADLLSRVAA